TRSDRDWSSDVCSSDLQAKANGRPPVTAYPLDFDPEARPSLVQALGRLPWLVYRCLRWRALRGGWLPGYLRRHRPFRRDRVPPEIGRASCRGRVWGQVG